MAIPGQGGAKVTAVAHRQISIYRVNVLCFKAKMNEYAFLYSPFSGPVGIEMRYKISLLTCPQAVMNLKDRPMPDRLSS